MRVLSIKKYIFEKNNKCNVSEESLISYIRKKIKKNFNSNFFSLVENINSQNEFIVKFLNL